MTQYEPWKNVRATIKGEVKGKCRIGRRPAGWIDNIKNLEGEMRGG